MWYDRDNIVIRDGREQMAEGFLKNLHSILLIDWYDVPGNAKLFLALHTVGIAVV